MWFHKSISHDGEEEYLSMITTNTERKVCLFLIIKLADSQNDLVNLCEMFSFEYLFYCSR